MAACSAPGVWSNLWPQLLVMLAGGGFFSIGWGLVTARRDVLLRSFDRVSVLLDDATAAFTALVKSIESCQENRDNLSEDEDERRDGLTKIYDRLGEHALATLDVLLRTGAFQDAARLFNTPRVRGAAAAYVAAMREAQAVLVNIDFMNPDHDVTSVHGRELVAQCFATADALRDAMFEEVRFLRIVRFIATHRLRSF
ncbi:MAG TPA: hypothetical protein VFV19_02955 [Candidatus Polarisedimenticolaceae bacterium]|nr:hypothetical protein [Candidatus Polarisedimenticolaceae bacterium]